MESEECNRFSTNLLVVQTLSQSSLQTTGLENAKEAAFILLISAHCFTTQYE